MHRLVLFVLPLIALLGLSLTGTPTRRPPRRTP